MIINRSIAPRWTFWYLDEKNLTKDGRDMMEIVNLRQKKRGNGGHFTFLNCIYDIKILRKKLIICISSFVCISQMVIEICQIYCRLCCSKICTFHFVNGAFLPLRNKTVAHQFSWHNKTINNRRRIVLFVYITDCK
jgi:hypothetical protein